MPKKAASTHRKPPNTSTADSALTPAAAEAPGQEAGLISVGIAARLLMCTPQFVQLLERQGWFQKVSRGQYRLVDVVQGHINYLKDENRRASKTAAAARVQEARAKEIELRVAKDAGALIDTDEAIAVVDEVIGLLKSEIGGLPARVTRDMELRRALDAEITNVFSRTYALVSERAAILRATGEAPALPVAPEDEAASTANGQGA